MTMPAEDTTGLTGAEDVTTSTADDQVAALAEDVESSEPAAQLQPTTEPAPGATPAEAQVPEQPQPTVPVPGFPAPKPQNMPPEVQSYVDMLEQQAQAAQAQNERRMLDDAVHQYSQQLLQQGFTDEQAQYIARREGDLVYKQYQSEQLRKRQIDAAFTIAREFNIDPRPLLELQNAQAMQQMAKTLSATNQQAQKITNLEAQVAKLTKGAVPAQTFAQGAQPGAGPALAGDALEAAWLKHETEHPNRPNPYDAQYRLMIR